MVNPPDLLPVVHFSVHYTYKVLYQIRFQYLVLFIHLHLTFIRQVRCVTVGHNRYRFFKFFALHFHEIPSWNPLL